MSRCFLGSEVPVPQMYLENAAKLKKKNLLNKQIVKKVDTVETTPKTTKAESDQIKQDIENFKDEPDPPTFGNDMANIYASSFQGSQLKRKCIPKITDITNLKKVRLFDPRDLVTRSLPKGTITINHKDEPKSEGTQSITKKIDVLSIADERNTAQDNVPMIASNKSDPMNKDKSPAKAPTRQRRNTKSKPEEEKKTNAQANDAKNDVNMAIEKPNGQKDEAKATPMNEEKEAPKDLDEEDGKEEKKGKKAKKEKKEKPVTKSARKSKKKTTEEGDPIKPSKVSKPFFKKGGPNFVRLNLKNKYKDRFRGTKHVLKTMYRPNGRFKFRKYKKKDENQPQGVQIDEDIDLEDLKADETNKDGTKVVKTKEERAEELKELKDRVIRTKMQTSKFLSRGLAQSLETQSFPEIEVEKDPLEMQDEDHLKMLQHHFGYKSFKICQLDGIKRVLNGQSTLVILNTGSGKSLIYQYSSLLMKGLTIVISPLLSLVIDQLQKLPLTLRGASINSTLTLEEKRKVLSLVCEGKVKILYLSPEYLSLETFDNFPPISFVCVDEVHCMSEWSHNFRTSYFFLRSNFKKKFGDPIFLGLTATATLSTQRSICSLLGLNQEAIIWNNTQNKDQVLSVSRDRDPFRGLLSLLKSPKFKVLRSIIVYCNMRSTVEALARFLSTNGISAMAYHAEKSDAQRQKIQEEFMTNKYRVIVATIAFGMGIDKQDVSAVIHLSLPHTLENYVQEIGRSGRDGKKAYCHLFLKDEDYFKTRNMTYGGFVEKNMVRTLINKLLGQCLNPAEFDDEAEKKPIFCLKFTDILQQLDLRIETLITIVARIDHCNTNFFKLIGTSKTKCIVGFYKTQPEVLMEKSEFLSKLVTNAKKVRGSYSINLCTLANLMHCGIEDCLGELRILVRAGEITYQLEEEGFVYQLNYIPQAEELADVIDTLYEKIKAVETMSIQKLDAIYYVMRISAQPSVEYMLKNGDLDDKKAIDVNIDNGDEIFQLEIEAKMDSELLIRSNKKIQGLIVDYFKTENIDDLLNTIDEDYRKEDVLPLCMISEEERMGIIEDALRFIKGQPDIYHTGDESKKDVNNLSSRRVLKIFQGVNSKHTPISEWKNNSYWAKYHQYETESLDSCIKDAITLHYCNRDDHEALEEKTLEKFAQEVSKESLKGATEIEVEKEEPAELREDEEAEVDIQVEQEIVKGPEAIVEEKVNKEVDSETQEEKEQL